MLLPGAALLDLGPALAHLAEHGYARLGRVLDEAGLAALQERADDLMLGRRVIEGLFFQPDSSTGSYGDLAFGAGFTGPSLAYRKLEKLEKDERFLTWLRNPLFERIAAALIGGEVALYRACLMNKAASGGTELPWHQDGGRFWGVEPDPTLQIWTALDDVPPESGCLEVLPGSHRHGLASADGGNLSAAEVAAARTDERALALPAEAGEVLLLHNHLWHRSGRNTTPRPRRAFTVCFMTAAARCLRRRRAPRVFLRPFAPR